MANTMTQTVATVFGDKRVLIGTVTMGDSASGLSVKCGLNVIDFVTLQGEASCGHTMISGGFLPLTAASGAVFKVMVVGA
jgi:hypothetical protein